MTAKSFLRDVFSMQTLKYMLVGSIAGGANVIVYFTLKNFFKINYLFSNLISLSIGVVLSYALNKKHVFNTNLNGKLFELKEFFHFISGRIVSLILDMLLLWGFVDFMKMGSGIAKFLDSAIVSILNYLICKLLVFKA